MADEISYEASPLVVRDEIVAAHERAWARLAAPGTWWDGAARVAIAAEARQARACGLCRRRRSRARTNAWAICLSHWWT